MVSVSRTWITYSVNFLWRDSASISLTNSEPTPLSTCCLIQRYKVADIKTRWKVSTWTNFARILAKIREGSEDPEWVSSIRLRCYALETPDHHSYHILHSAQSLQWTWELWLWRCLITLLSGFKPHIVCGLPTDISCGRPLRWVHFTISAPFEISWLEYAFEP